MNQAPGGQRHEPAAIYGTRPKDAPTQPVQTFHRPAHLPPGTTPPTTKRTTVTTEPNRPQHMEETHP